MAVVSRAAAPLLRIAPRTESVIHQGSSPIRWRISAIPAALGHRGMVNLGHMSFPITRSHSCKKA
jgi:hypothetical protein